jgi:hypothetical protein
VRAGLPQGGNKARQRYGQPILAMPLDHLATWNEVCDAVAFSSPDVFERISACEVCCEVAPDSRGGVRVLAEEFAWLALAKEAMQARSN